MPVTCFDCGQPGHIAAECQNRDEIDKRPAWCGICDRRTRLVTIDRELGTVRKCHDCHPSPRKLPVQHKRCPSCKCIVHAWDTGQCGSHQMPGAPDNRLPLDAIHEIERSNS